MTVMETWKKGGPINPLEHLLEHPIVCENCVSKTTLAEILSKPRARACCTAMHGKRRSIFDQVADLHRAITGKKCADD